MELTKTDIISKVSAQYRPYIEALRTPNLKDSNRVDNLKAIYTALITATTYTGAKNEDNGANKFLSEKFYEEIFIKYPYARHGEIMLAFKKGALREYGEYFGVNVQTLYNWFKKYQESDELKKAKLECNQLLDEETGIKRADKPIGSVFEVTIDHVNNLFLEYKVSGNLPSFARIYYDSLCKIKGVKSLITDKEARELIRESSFKEYIASLRAKKYHIKEPDNYNKLINSFDKDSATFASISKRLALKWYFDEQIKQGNEFIK